MQLSFYQYDKRETHLRAGQLLSAISVRTSQRTRHELRPISGQKHRVPINVLYLCKTVRRFESQTSNTGLYINKIYIFFKHATGLRNTRHYRMYMYKSLLT